ncbi:MAG: hypothetical protein ACI9CF_001070 [Candidatus Omnitrophota bacterium]|jgi:hypothetical protein
MGYKTKQQMIRKQAIKRLKKRARLAKDGQKPEELFYTGVWVGPRK